MLNILNKIYSTQKTVSIYTNGDETDKFNFGKVIALNDEQIAVQMISPNGEYDGVIVMNIEKVIRIETDGQYELKMQKLCSLTKPLLPNVNLANENIFESAMLSSIKDHCIVSVELLDSGYIDIVGYVKKIENGQCEIKQVDEYGADDGFSCFSIDDVTQICFASEDERRIEKLYELNS